MRLRPMAWIVTWVLLLPISIVSAEIPGFEGLEQAEVLDMSGLHVAPAPIDLQPSLGRQLLEGVSDDVSSDQVAALLTFIEQCVGQGRRISGTYEVRSGVEVDVVNELRRQSRVWTESVSRAYVSLDGSAPLSARTAEEFVAADGLDAQFDQLFDAVIDREASIETRQSGVVNPADNAFVAERYRAIEADILQYNNAVFLASFATDPEIKRRAIENAEGVAARLHALTEDLRLLFTED